MRSLAVFFLAGTLAWAQLPMTRRAPGFSLPDSGMKQHDLQDYQGKVVLIEFMQTTCPKCIELTKELGPVKQKYGDKVAVLSVVTQPDTLQSVQRFIATYKPSGPLLFDCGQMMASYMNITPQNPQVEFPRLMVIDGSGVIRADLSERSPGGLTGAAINAAVDAASRPAAAPAKTKPASR